MFFLNKTSQIQKKSELVSPACIKLYEVKSENLTAVNWFAGSFGVDVTYGTSCRRAHHHSASSYSLDISTTNLHRKFIRGKAQVKVKSKTLSFGVQSQHNQVEERAAVPVWDGGPPSLVPLLSLKQISSPIIYIRWLVNKSQVSG